MKFAELLSTLENTDHLDRLTLVYADGSNDIIENKPGSQGSVRVYHHLWKKFGFIDQKAAELGLKLYAEHTEDALNNPGKHPNIDRLLAIIDSAQILKVEIS